MPILSKAIRMAVAAALAAGIIWAAAADASDFKKPWLRSDRALVVDAYEYNAIDWTKLAADKRIVGFIGKATDGLPPPSKCEDDDDVQLRLCRALWKRYAVAQELFRTRRMIAKALGLKWGAYHVARPGNPIDQANHFIDFAEPGPDDLVALDIEEIDPYHWMSLSDAEEFARHVMRRIGRYPVLYTNDTTAGFIAAHKQEYPLLSRLPLWYARYKPDIADHFPKGNWDGYTLWQFSSQANCGERNCPYRVPGTPTDIDVNVAAMDADALRKAWPLNALADNRQELIASVPVPLPRQDALAGKEQLVWAAVDPKSDVKLLAAAYSAIGNRYPVRNPPSFTAVRHKEETRRAYLAALEDRAVALAEPASPGIDATTTAAFETREARNEEVAYGP
ncbi:MAG: muramidase [Rhizobiales bacterium 65-79]|jgi:GH25 family lysozyme M1 (1,4-beta-N-acetylmuramidase)|nr:MAG: muramidase [Rhizobiales bacterium 65-79]